MKSKIYFLSFLFVVFFSFAQSQTIELTFTGKSGSFHVPLDSILIENLTQGGDTTLYYPDTVLLFETVGINEVFEKNDFMVLHNYPNPFNDQTLIDIYLPGASNIEILIFNAIGGKLISYENNLSRGIHSFSFKPGNEGFYFLSVSWRSEAKTIKMLSLQNAKNQSCDLQYEGTILNTSLLKHQKSVNGFVYNPGNQLQYIGFAVQGKDTIIDTPTENQDYEFEFEMGIPCPGIPTFTYGGQIYNTVQIGTQCWMKENLNIGTMIIGTNNQSNNGTIEKYCYGDDTNNCNNYGGLYQWDEMMQYVTTVGVQGICPSGWHLPSDAEWTTLTDHLGGTGVAGGKMKETGTTHWYSPNTGATNSSGFSALPAGNGDGGSSGSFGNLGFLALFWSSTELSGSIAWYWRLSYNYAGVVRGSFSKMSGFSVRCSKD